MSGLGLVLNPSQAHVDTAAREKESRISVHLLIQRCAVIVFVHVIIPRCYVMVSITERSNVADERCNTALK